MEEEEEHGDGFQVEEPWKVWEEADLVMVLLCVSTTVFRSVSCRNGSWK